MEDFKDENPCFAVLKHNNVCGISVRTTLLDAWKDALAGDPVSAFGGVLICNKTLDLDTAKEIDLLFYEVLIAPDYEKAALDLLKGRKNRILLKVKSWPNQNILTKSALGGKLYQERDTRSLVVSDLRPVTKIIPTSNYKKRPFFHFLKVT